MSTYQHHCEGEDKAMTLPSGICIYVVCLAAKDQGQQHGVWVDLLADEAHIESEIKKMLSESPALDAKAWLICEQRGLGKLDISNIKDIRIIAAFARLIDEYGEDLCEAVLDYVSCLQDAVEMMEQRYYGEHVSEAQFVEDYVKELYGIPDNLAYYMDFERMADDWFYDYVSIEVGDSIHVFSN